MDKPKKPRPVTHIKVWMRTRTEPVIYSGVGLRADVGKASLVLTRGGAYVGKVVAMFAAGQWLRVEVETDPAPLTSLPV